MTRIQFSAPLLKFVRIPVRLTTSCMIDIFPFFFCAAVTYPIGVSGRCFIYTLRLLAYCLLSICFYVCFTCSYQESSLHFQRLCCVASCLYLANLEDEEIAFL